MIAKKHSLTCIKGNDYNAVDLSLFYFRINATPIYLYQA